MKYVIVNDPRLGDSVVRENKHYEKQAGYIYTWLKRNGAVKSTEDVIIVASVDEAVRQFEGHGERGAMIFLTAHTGPNARDIAQKFQKRVRVFCYTGRIPDGKVIYFDKSWGGVESFVEAIVSSPP